MWDMNDVVDIEYKGGFVYRVVFDDGKSGSVDFSEYRGGGLSLNPCAILLSSGRQGLTAEPSPGRMAPMWRRKRFMRR